MENFAKRSSFRGTGITSKYPAILVSRNLYIRYTKTDVCCLPRCGLTHIGFLVSSVRPPSRGAFENSSTIAPPPLPAAGPFAHFRNHKACIPEPTALESSQRTKKSKLPRNSLHFIYYLLFRRFDAATGVFRLGKFVEDICDRVREDFSRNSESSRFRSRANLRSQVGVCVCSSAISFLLFFGRLSNLRWNPSGASSSV